MEEKKTASTAPAEEGAARIGAGRKFNRRCRAFILRAKGFTGRSARKWVRRVDNDRHNDNGYTSSQKKQAYDWGFLPKEVDHFGITEANRHSMISERDYLFLHPMNGKYDKWIRDRVSALNVFSSFSNRFEVCHFHIIRRAGKPFFIPMSEATANLQLNAAGLRELLEEKGALVVTSASWSNSAYWILEAAANDKGEQGYALDGVFLTKKEFDCWLSESTRRQLLVVIEPAPASSQLNTMAPGAQSALRVVMLNRDGANPFVGQAYIRLAYPESIFADAADLVDEDDDLQEEEGDQEVAGVEFDGEQILLPISARRKRIPQRNYFSSVDPQTGAFAGLAADVDGKIVREEKAFGSELPFQGVIPGWQDIVDGLAGMCRFIPQVEFAEFEINVQEDGFVITAIRSLPSFGRVIPFSAEVNSYLLAKCASKREAHGSETRRKRFFKNSRLKIRRHFAKAVALKGLVPYQSVRWIGDMRRDLMSKNGLSLSQKMWAYRHGFLSYRITQYGITEDNWKEFISDFEYRWLRHINSKYKYWLEDKITLKYIASDFKECFPGYYYYTSLKDGENRVIPMMDLPEGYGTSYEDILRLGREKGLLALKPDEGSHGQGFFRMEWTGECFLLNGQETSDEEIIKILSSPENQYLVTEYIVMHPQLMELYPGSVNTIRVTVFKRDGRVPQVGNVYMRIGSTRTGFVDNVAAGGIVAAVDIESGRYGDAMILDGVDQGNLVPCPVHPDTGVRIEGVLPNWEYAKARILDIASAIPQMEYFGFDLAITPDGIKLPEINRFPDFPRIDKLTPEIIEYLLYRLECKKHVYKYDVEPCTKPLRLPER